MPMPRNHVDGLIVLLHYLRHWTYETKICDGLNAKHKGNTFLNAETLNGCIGLSEFDTSLKVSEESKSTFRVVF